MRAVDTNVLVRLFAQDDEEQVAAAAEFVRGGAWVSHVVLVETVWVLVSVYSVRPEGVADAIEHLLDHESLVVQEGDVVRGAVSLFRKRPVLGFSDCLVLELAKKAGHVPLGTFDRDLGKLDGAERI